MSSFSTAITLLISWDIKDSTSYGVTSGQQHVDIPVLAISEVSYRRMVLYLKSFD